MKYKKCFLIAPSGYIEQTNLDLAKKRLKELGFEEIIYRIDILSKYLSYAGDYVRRSREIDEAFESSADIVFVVLGGQGAIQVLPYINYDLIKNTNKLIVGLSDATILLNTIHRKTGTRCLHGPNIGKNHDLNKKTLDILIKAINRENYEIFFQDENILVKGITEGKIVGGNVELLGRSLGTPFEIETDNKIIFLEDYEMKSWRVFDILWQLKASGKFNNIRGVIIGQFVNCGKDIDDYLKEFFKDFDVPIIINQEIGHAEPNITIPIGEKCIIDTENKKWEILFEN